MTEVNFEVEFAIREVTVTNAKFGEHWSVQHDREVRGEGNYPLSPDYIDEFITSKARSGPAWAQAYAILQLAHAINVLGGQIGGVDDFTGIQKIGAWLEAMVMDARKRDTEDGR
jgi:hypothetical protein